MHDMRFTLPPQDLNREPFALKSPDFKKKCEVMITDRGYKCRITNTVPDTSPINRNVRSRDGVKTDSWVMFWLFISL